MTKVTAIAIAAWPLLEGLFSDPDAAAPLLERLGPMMSEGGPWMLAALALVFLRRSIPAGLLHRVDGLLDSFHKVFTERDALRERVRELTAELEALRSPRDDDREG